MSIYCDIRNLNPADLYKFAIKQVNDSYPGLLLDINEYTFSKYKDDDLWLPSQYEDELFSYGIKKYTKRNFGIFKKHDEYVRIFINSKLVFDIGGEKNCYSFNIKVVEDFIKISKRINKLSSL